jgi:predicted negative regulator of RcsB-dependent stress response
VIDDYYNEQEQWERVKQWLRENGPWLVVGVLLGLGALAGWRWWEQRQEARAQSASASYGLLLETLQSGDRAKGLVLADEIRKEHGASAYADQADLVAARALVETGEFGPANERLTRVMKSSKDPQLKLVARSRLARVQLAQGNADAAIATLAGAQPGAFGPLFESIRGDALYAKGDRPGALAAWRKAEADAALFKAAPTVDFVALQLKIGDLLADGVKEPAAAAPAAKPAAAAAAPAAPAPAAPAAPAKPGTP